MTQFPYSHKADGQGPRVVDAGPWRVILHPPVLVRVGSTTEHITRPNLCKVGPAIAAIFQTTFDTSATPADHKEIAITLDEGKSWTSVHKNVDIGSYALMNKPDASAVVMPYDSIRFGQTANTLTGPRSKLTWQDGNVVITRDRTTASFPSALKGFALEPIKDDSGKPLYLENDLPPADKPITAFWGTTQALPDGRWITAAYGCYESDPLAVDSPSPDMRRMARFSTHLLVSSDEGRTWTHHCKIAGPGDVPQECVEGPSEVQLFQFPGKWRVVFRTSALKNFFQPLHYSESTDQGKSWTKPAVLKTVDMIMDPRGLQLPAGVTVLSAGRPKIGLYLAQDDSLDFHKIDMNLHHNSYLPRLRTTGHTDIIPLSDQSLLFTYDYIPDSWRWPGSAFTSPDAILSVKVEWKKV